MAICASSMSASRAPKNTIDDIMMMRGLGPHSVEGHSDDAIAPQLSNLTAAETKLLQNCIGILAERRRWRACRHDGTIRLEAKRRHVRGGVERRYFDWRTDLPRTKLLLRQHFADCANARGGNGMIGQKRLPLIRTARPEPVGKDFAQSLAVLRTRRRFRKAFIAQDIFAIERST